MQYTISEAKQGIRSICIPGLIQPMSIFLWGPPGIGKSEMVDQIRKEYGADYQLIDLRLAQIDNVDLRGIPYIDPELKILKWAVPEDLPTEDNPLFKDTKGFLFLDEFNRARGEVQQSAFQLVLDRAIGGHKILQSWFIIAAGNMGYNDNTDVGEMDAALKNRFAHFEIKSDPEEWITWAKANNIHEDIVGFIQTHPNYLYYKIDKDDEMMTLVTPRSWVKFSKIIQQNDKISTKIINNRFGPSVIGVCSGHFNSYLEDKNTVSANDICFHYTKVKAKLKASQRDQIQAINRELTSFVAKKSTSWDEDKIKVAMDNFYLFITECLEDDLAVAFCRQTWQECKGSKSGFMLKFMDLHPDVADLNIAVLNNTRK